MTDAAARAKALLVLCSSAHGFAAASQLDPCSGDNVDAFYDARHGLHRCALEYAAACGQVDAKERAELEALRQLRDGMVGMRKEVADGHTDIGEPVTPTLVLSTIDALLQFCGGPK